jgi:hypothetical protein
MGVFYLGILRLIRTSNSWRTLKFHRISNFTSKFRLFQSKKLKKICGCFGFGALKVD